MTTKHGKARDGLQKFVCATAAALLATAMLLGPTVASAGEIDSSILRGGLLYDKWFKVVKIKPPKAAHVSYPAEGKYYGKKGADWRCKECHGWDYRGKDGYYSTGKHFTGIKGITGARDASVPEIVAILKNETHGYSEEMMDLKDFIDLARFVKYGQFDMNPYIDRATKTPKGDTGKGEVYFNTVCANCHGFDGKKIKEALLAKEANSNPWEVLHKIRNGQPAETMPSLRAFDPQVAVDIVSHLKTLPTK